MPQFRDSDAAFADAIKSGRLSADESAPNYAGGYMYMGHWTENGTVTAKFKNKMTRRYDV